MKKGQIFLYLLLTFVAGILGVFIGLKVFAPDIQTNNNSTTGNKSAIEETEHITLIQEAYELIEENYIEDIDGDQLLEGAIEGMIDTLDDPYSSYMNTEAMEEFNEQIESSFQGIGAEVSLVDGIVTIVSPIKNSPAEKAGLRPNDQILKVDDESLEGLDLNEAVAKIRGEKGSEVELEVQRKGESKSKTYTLVRDDIPIETVYSSTEEVDGKETGVIEITSFSETTSEEFAEALTKLEDEGMEGLVIDVRGNPGGLLDSIEEILHHFVPKDIPYLQIEDGKGNVDKFYTDLEEKKDYPINIVVDEGSASASEILAVAMKEIGYDIVGETTFGKGTVQQAVPLGDNADENTIKLTYFKWLSPEGNWIHDKGVEPTVEQKQPDYYYTSPIEVEKPFKLDQTDDEIKQAQIMLQGLGYDTDREDGYFDEKTKKAVESFQKDHDLEVSGQIDDKTAGTLETTIVEHIREGKEDLQMEKALETLYK